MATNTTISRRTGVNNACNTNSNDNGLAEVEQRQEAQILKENDQTSPEEGQSSEEKEMSKHIETRNKLKSIADISSFNDLLNKSTLSDEEKLLLKLHYIQAKDFRYIGDMLGYAESTIKKKHRRILAKLNKLF